MGISLETVQVKFASIIEDLSECPQTLSQFVVWVDLCVAEYKSNGFIYLNCSGKKPEPSWLSGLKEDILDTVEDTIVKEHRFTNRNPTKQHRSALTDNVAQLCDDIVTIRTKKNIVNADGKALTRFFGATRGYHGKNAKADTRLSEAKTSNRSSGDAQSRVATGATCLNASRRVACASTSTSDHIYAMEVGSPKKQKSMLERSSGAGTACCKPHTETISVTENRSHGVYPVGLIQVSSQNSRNMLEDEEEFLEVVDNPLRVNCEDKDVCGAANPVVVETLMDVSPPQSLQEGERDSPLCDPQLNGHLASTRMSDAQRRPVIKTESESSLQESDHCNNNTGDTCSAYPGYIVLEIRESGELSAPVKTQSADDYWSSYGTCIPGPVKKARTNVGNMHRWLQQDQSEARQIEEIPPEELDPYLAEFLSLVRRKDGRDYDPNSFKDVRGSIQRYLQDHGYPYSIVRSPLFYNSQRAYYRKKEQLRHSLFLKNRKTEHLNCISLQ